MTTGSWTASTKDYTWFKGLYDGDDLTYNGTNTAPFDNVFVVTGSKLTLNPALIPEPSSFVLAAMGLLGLAFVAWRRRRK